MLILNYFPIVQRAERPEKVRDTVRGARLIKSRVKLEASTLRRRWKLRLVMPGIGSSQSASRRTQRTKQRCRERLQHQFKKSESLWKPDARKIEDSRHLGLIMACLPRHCKSDPKLASNPIVSQ